MAAVSAVTLVAYFGLSHVFQAPRHSEGPTQTESHCSLRTIEDTIECGENLFHIFKRNGLNLADLFTIKQAAAGIHRLRELQRGQRYSIAVDDQNCVDSLVYWIDDEFLLKVERNENGFQAQRCKIPYETRILTLRGSIEDNLVSSIGEGKERLLLALKLSDIFAWDIDFTSDVQKGDAYSIVAEGLYIDGQFRRYGKILSAVFVNDGNRHVAYRFEWDGRADYFDAEGKSLRKAFLRAPLSFRRISSHFSRKRRHPVLRIYRPHRGVDYAAARGTPVSSTRDGRVIFAGRKGQYGKLVIIKHGNRYVTYYGHLSRFARGIRRGVTVNQGDVVGYVGATGLATGPHLHYEIRQAGRFINPLALNGDRCKGIPPALMAQFNATRASMEKILARSEISSANPVVHTARTDKR